MKKEPWIFYLIRLSLLLILIVLALMLYWSTESNETKLIEIKNTLSEIRDELQSPGFNQDSANSPVKQIPSPQFSEKYVNLLEEDPYYAVTLPKQLGPDFKPYGIRKNAVVGKPDNLHPFSNWANSAAWISMCQGSVGKSKFGIFETLAPDLAFRMEQRGDKEFWIFLKNTIYWEPLKQSWFPSSVILAPEFTKKHKVKAEDYKFFFDCLMNPHLSESGAVALRTYLGDIQSVEVIDDYTFKVIWKSPRYVIKQLTASLKPLPKYIYAYFADGSPILEDSQDFANDPIFALNFANHWAKNIIPSCGPWVFDGMSDRMINFKRNSDFPLKLEALSEGSETEFMNAPESVWQQFKDEKLDTYAVRPEQLAELEDFLKSDNYLRQPHKIERIDYISRTFQYIGWNMARELFKSRKVRQALTMAIDRERIIRQTLNGMGIPIHSGFYPFSSSVNPDIQPWPFNPQKSKEFLEEEGWFDSDGDGIIDKMIDGKRVPFRFQFSYYVKNPTSKSIAEYVKTALFQIGIKVDLNGIDVADLTKLFDDKDFDSLILGWSLGTPPEDPRQLWYSAGAKEKGSSNAVGFANAEADKIINELDFERDPDKRILLYHRFDQIIHDEQPYTFLFTPKVALLYRDYVKNVFIPKDRQDLVPGANMGEPEMSVTWIDRSR